MLGRFTFLLQHSVSHGLPYMALVFSHVVESLVFVPIIFGIVFFLFEFYSDQLVRTPPHITLTQIIALNLTFLFLPFLH